MRAAVVALSMLASEAPARADATLFAGTNSFGGIRPTLGISVGNFSNALGESVGWELELAKGLRGGPTTYGGGFLVQSILIADRLRPYGTFGLGIYASDGRGQIAFASVGGGTKFRGAGPLWLRFDYRLLLHGDDTPEHLRYPHRVTAGVSVEF
jgi:hypothetical protein